MQPPDPIAALPAEDWNQMVVMPLPAFMTILGTFMAQTAHYVGLRYDDVDPRNTTFYCRTCGAECTWQSVLDFAAQPCTGKRDYLARSGRGTHGGADRTPQPTQTMPPIDPAAQAHADDWTFIMGCPAPALLAMLHGIFGATNHFVGLRYDGKDPGKTTFKCHACGLETDWPGLMDFCETPCTGQRPAWADLVTGRGAGQATRAGQAKGNRKGKRRS